MYEGVIDALSQDDDYPECLRGTIIHKGKPVRLFIDPDGEDIKDSLLLVNKFLSSFDNYLKRAEEQLIKDCLVMYNDDWRGDDDPVLSKEEFINGLTLEAINFLSVDSVDYFFNDNGMFGGHSLIPQVFDGETFECVQMYG